MCGVVPLACSHCANDTISLSHLPHDPDQIPGTIEGVTFRSLGARCLLVVEKDAVFTYLCGQRVWDTLPCIVLTGCGYPPLSVRAVARSLASLLSLPVLGLFDYNPHGARILLTYKFGSTRMGLEAHAYAVDIKWLGVHYDDIMERSDDVMGQPKPKVPASALQPWSTSDERVFGGVAQQVGTKGTYIIICNIGATV